MHRKCLIVAIMLMLVSVEVKSNNLPMSDLKPVKQYVRLANDKKVLLYREFRINGEIGFLGADSTSMKTFILKPEEILSELQFSEFEKTKLYRILQLKEPIKFININKGYILTIDLCAKPKKQERKFEEDLLNFLIDLSEEKNIPTPVGFAVSGVWILQEPEYFNKIINARKEKKVDVTWINHSMKHPVMQGKFLTAQSVNFEKEVLEFELLLLNRGEMPSLFFRFPGLVYNEELIIKLSNLSLIPLDSNAWLAKGQKPKAGSIILVHGNGNERRGIDIFFKIFTKEISDFVSIYDLEG